MLRKLSATLIACGLACHGVSAQSGIKVSDFGAFPNDGKDDLTAIRKAISAAAETGAKTISFDAGTYDIMAGTPTSGILLQIKDIEGLSFIGATNDKGEPATVLMRHYKMIPNKVGSNLIKVISCNDFLLKNIIFDNTPQYMTAGEVVKNNGKSIYVKIFDGNPYYDGTSLFCCNLWDLETKDLLHVGSVTFGGDVRADKEKYMAHIDGNPKKRILRIDAPDIVSKAKAGMGISWNFGWEGRQVVFERCDNLHVENVWTYSALGFCMEAYMCHNVYSNGVQFKRTGNQLHVGSRDAWKLHACTGEAVMENMYCEGVRWDGQNVHGSFLWVKDKPDDHTVVLGFRAYDVHSRIEPGQKVGFMEDRENEHLLTIKSVERFKNEQGFYDVKLTMEEPLPDFLNDMTICNMYSWCLDSYKLINSEFRNIAGTASLLRQDNAEIRGCRFYNIMYPAVCIGGALHEGEGVIAKNVKITGCEFISSGWQARHGAYGAVAVRVQRKSGISDSMIPYVKDIVIENNIFRNCEIGIQAEGVKGLILRNNQFDNVNQPAILKDDIDVVED